MKQATYVYYWFWSPYTHSWIMKLGLTLLLRYFLLCKKSSQTDIYYCNSDLNARWSFSIIVILIAEQTQKLLKNGLWKLGFSNTSANQQLCQSYRYTTIKSIPVRLGHKCTYIKSRWKIDRLISNFSFTSLIFLV